MILTNKKLWTGTLNVANNNNYNNDVDVLLPSNTDYP